MRRILCVLVLLSLLAGMIFMVLAEEEDDSVIIPVDIEEPAEEVETQPARDMQRGDSGDDVLFLQTRLKDLKYYNGELSGNFGNATRDAVKTSSGTSAWRKPASRTSRPRWCSIPRCTAR